MLEQQQMRWALNNKIEELSNKANNLLKNEKYGVCQNINKFISGINSCNSSDVAKCESCLSTVNHTLNSASDLRSSIDNKRKELFLEGPKNQGEATRAEGTSTPRKLDFTGARGTNFRFN